LHKRGKSKEGDIAMYNFFPENYTWTFRIAVTVNESYLGGGNFGEIMRVVQKLNPSEPASWSMEWEALGGKVNAMAEEAESEGLSIIARDRYLRASNYFRNAEFFQPGGEHPQRMSLYNKSLTAFRKGIRTLPHIQPVEIPYENSFLPGYFINASQKREKRPVLVFFGGLDSTAEQLFFGLGRACSEWGLSCLIVDGPGQGGALRINKILTRYDYEVPAKAAFDYLLTKEEVDSKRIALIALSMGGYYAPRAVAFERRYAACIVWAPEWDLAEFWGKRPDNYPLGLHLMWVMGVGNMKAAREKLRDFHLKDVAPLIECPTLVLHGQNDQQVPVSHATRLYEALRCPKTLKIFTNEEGGDQHCQGDDLIYAREVIFSWLTETLRITPP
jgi:pimeloyl-ACP methyl ester carboxylesterase